MTLADYSMAAFALLNGGRAVAYFPQIGLTASKRVSVGRRASLGHVIDSLRQSRALVDLLPKIKPSFCSRHEAPSARHRDAMILHGLMS